MRPLRRWLALVVLAVLAALVAGCAPAGSAAPAATGRHVKDVTAAHANGGVHLIHRGLVQDCMYIENGTGIQEIKGNGVNKPVTLTTAPGNCFNRVHEFIVFYGTTHYTGWEYQNVAGHCLFDNGGTIDVGAACKALHPNEEFFGIPGSQSQLGGWLVSDVTRGPNVYMGAPFQLPSLSCGGSGDRVVMSPNLDCNTWNFPG